MTSTTAGFILSDECCTCSAQSMISHSELAMAESEDSTDDGMAWRTKTLSASPVNWMSLTTFMPSRIHPVKSRGGCVCVFEITF